MLYSGILIYAGKGEQALRELDIVMKEVYG